MEKRAGLPKAAPSRVGKTNLTAYLSPAYKSNLRLIQAKTGRSLQALIAEALEELFSKYSVTEDTSSTPPSARPLGKRGNPEYTQIGPYVRKSTKKAMSIRMLETGEGDLSDLIERLLTEWLARPR